MAAEVDKQDCSPKVSGLFPAWVVNLWIATILMWFFVIRVLGSGTGRHVLSVVGLRHGE